MIKWMHTHCTLSTYLPTKLPCTYFYTIVNTEPDSENRINRFFGATARLVGARRTQRAVGVVHHPQPGLVGACDAQRAVGDVDQARAGLVGASNREDSLTPENRSEVPAKAREALQCRTLA